METGAYISGLGHIAILGWAALGSAFLESEPQADFKITDVSLISAADFAALNSAAPAPETDIARLDAPDSDASKTDTPSPLDAPRLAALAPPETPQDPGRAPDISALTPPPQTAAQIDAPRLDQDTATDQVGATLISPTAPLSNRDSAGRVQPDKLAMVVPPLEQAAPRVDSTPAPAPDPSAEKAPQTETATTPDPTAQTPAEATTEKAPDQAASQIVTEANRTESDTAPVKSSRPRGRPANLADRANSASEIEQALAQAQAEQASQRPAAPITPTGPPLTGGEKDGLRLAVQQCWNVNPSSEAARITVVISFAMEKSGQPLLNTIRMVSASDGADSAKRSAYDAARRAIIRCANGGYKLPVEKFDHWRDIEMTFNPEKMRIR
jgi:hypothetical protein